MIGDDVPIPSSPPEQPRRYDPAEQSTLADDEQIVDEPLVDQQPNGTLRDVVEWVAVIIVALVSALLIRQYAVQAFEIPSASMETTVNIGDRILVNKLSYLSGEVERGDLVVFERGTLTEGNTDELIKRAIGLPGETVELRDDGHLYIWGPDEGPEDAFRLDEPYIPQSVVDSTAPSDSDPVSVDVWDQRCVNQREVGRCTLDGQSYFMMGDNRFNSTDSRSFGPVPAENVVGRAFFRIWPPTEIGGL